MIQRYEYYNANIEPRSDGRIVFYADAEKWVQAEIDERDRTISRLNNDLCDRRISLEAALKLCKEKDEEIAVLTAQRDEATKEVELLIKERRALLDERDAHRREIAALIKEGQEAACINNHNVEVASQEIAKLRADNENMAKLNDTFPEEIARLEDEIAALKEKIETLRTLVDGASDIVEIYPAESPAQKEWRDNWLKKARESLK